MNCKPWIRLVTVLALAVAGPATSQTAPSLGEMAINWGRGHWASPVYCVIDGETVRGIRRIILKPPKHGSRGRPVIELHFVDMEVDDASRCFDAVGTDIPNVIGWLQLRFNGTSHPETAIRDFKRALKKDRGFEFSVPSGSLMVTTVEAPPSEPQTIDYRGGIVTLRVPARGSDAEKALADFRAPRKLVLEFAPKDGPAIRIPLFLTELR